jgi:hypothetical protein
VPGDVADADDADRALTLDDRKMAEIVLEHDLRRFFGGRVLRDRDGVGRHPLADRRLARVHAPGDRSQDVALGENSDQASVIGHDGGAGAALDHPLRRVPERVFGRDRQHVARHELTQGRHGPRA